MSEITIYSTPTCAYCKMAREYFKTSGIEYESVDVSTDQGAADVMIKKSGQMGVPVIVVNKGGREHVTVGFNQKEISAILGIE